MNFARRNKPQKQDTESLVPILLEKKRTKPDSGNGSQAKTDTVTVDKAETGSPLQDLITCIEKLKLPDFEDAEDQETISEPQSFLESEDFPIKRTVTVIDEPTGKNLSQFWADVNDQVKAPRAEVKKRLSAMRRTLIAEYCGNAPSQGQVMLVDSVVELNYLKDMLWATAMKHGILKINRHNGKMTYQTALKENLIPITRTVGVLLKQLADLGKVQIQRKATVKFSDGNYSFSEDLRNMSLEDLQKTRRSFEAILGRHPRPVSSITLEEKETTIH